MYTETKSETVSFRTYDRVNEKIEKLAARVKANKYQLSWSDPLRDAESKSGLITLVLDEKFTLQEIREKMDEFEEASDEDN